MSTTCVGNMRAPRRPTVRRSRLTRAGAKRVLAEPTAPALEVELTGAMRAVEVLERELVQSGRRLFAASLEHVEAARAALERRLDAAGLPRARPYDLRHSFASLLLHEGRSVVYVARQLGHSAKVCLEDYGHVIDELEDAPQLPAEDAIRQARVAHVPREFPRAR